MTCHPATVAGAAFVDGVKLEREDTRDVAWISSSQSTTIDNFPVGVAMIAVGLGLYLVGVGRQQA
jgi:hypothetical protein